VFKNTVPRRIFGPKKEKIEKGKRKLTRSKQGELKGQDM
jgi:hypothetical protein